MSKKLLFIAELTFAGILVGLLIGPGSFEQFFGVAFNNSTMLNLITGGAIGSLLGFIGSLWPEKPETE